MLLRYFTEHHGYTLGTAVLTSVRNSLYDLTKNLVDCFKNSNSYNNLPNFLFNRVQGFADRTKRCGS